MKRALAILVVTLLTIALTGTQLTSWVNANFLPSPPISTIYIKSDGSIQPSTAPIQRTDNIYSILSDLPNSTIEVQCDNVVIDGKGFTISGHGVHWHTGITLSGRIGVTIKNIHIRSFGLDIKMDNAARNNIIGNHIEATMDGVSMTNSNNNNISGNWISGVTYGVHGSGSLNKIIGNNFTGNTYSVRFYGDRNKISDNFFQDQTSIFLTGEKGSHYNTVSGNTMSGSKDGVYLLASSTNNVVFGNNITGKQEHGIYITECQNNTIYGNHIANNHVGIQIGFDPSLQERYPSINNLVHHNNLISNGENVRIERAKDGSLPSNCWDNGKEGNYWSDYQGIDANNDSIGDDFHVIDEHNQDRYPLMNPINFTDLPLNLPSTPSPPTSSNPSPSPSPTPNSTPTPEPEPKQPEPTAPAPSPTPQEQTSSQKPEQLEPTIPDTSLAPQEPALSQENEQLSVFPNIWISCSIIASVAIISFGLVAYFVKRSRRRNK